MAIGSFSAGLSGMSANSVYLNVIGNNLANINTIGFKASAVTFEDVVSQAVGGSTNDLRQVGLGVTTGSIAPVFSQGSIENTREATNVAIQGQGFFVVTPPNGGGAAYTRAGNFSFSNNGTLVSPDGYRVQGYTQTDPTTGRIVTTGVPTDIVLPPGVLRDPTPTTLFKTVTNLDSSAANGATFTASVQIYDSLGTGHVMTITYTKTAANTWGYQMTVPGAEVNPAPAGGAPAVVAAGTVTFNAQGHIASVTPTAPSTGGGTAVPGPLADVTITAPVWANGAQSATITWDIVDANQVGSLTGFTAPSATSSKSQNGSAAGTADNIIITSDGAIQATFGAGQSVIVAQLALASFNNPKGLVKLGANRYGESQAAGIPNVGTAGTGGRGTLIGSALEQSNVDIAQEFTQMILAQRGYQANSKTIVVSDEILVDTLNLKR
jgi:flagellar hook protein FlgE